MKGKLKVFFILIFVFTVFIMKEISLINIIDVPVTKINRSKLEDLGYSVYDMEILDHFLSDNQFQEIIKQNINRQILFSYLKFNSFDFKEISTYEQIRKTKKTSFLSALNLTHHPYMMSQFYQHIREAINTNNSIILVNKNYALDETYVPEDLVLGSDLNPLVPDNKDRYYLRKEAYNALKELFQAAENEGYILYFSNGYRSFNRQQEIHDEYLALSEDAENFSARAGHSEHQTGLAVDLTCKAADFSLSHKFAVTYESNFLIKNAHLFGFIIRYPENKVHLTGYTYEPWHIRYVGKKHASIIYQMGLTLEEYLIQYTELPK